MNGEKLKENEVPPEEQAATGAEPAAAGEPSDEAKKFVDTAEAYIYGNQDAFASIMNMIKADSKDPVGAISKAAISLIDKVEADLGQVDFDTINMALTVIAANLVSAAKKAGIMKANKGTILKAAGKTMALWMKNNPDRVDQSKVQQASQSGEGQKISQLAQQEEQAPPQPVQQPAQPAGMLGG